MGPWNILRKSLVCRIQSRIIWVNLARIPVVSFHNCQATMYREDYIKLGIPQNSTKEEIKAAYFVKAKQLHPDAKSSGQSDESQAEFFELNEAYKRLMYESKFGTDSFDNTDPRNDPRTREYWEIRTRRQSPEEIKFEEAMDNKNRKREKWIIRRGLIGLAIGVFFGTIFPAIFIGTDDYENDLSNGCQCNRCLLKRLRQNPTVSNLHLTRSNLRSSPNDDAVHAEYHK
eukprot:GFUD01004955.1.p1 GENE.GFUD01004955.1~~GFUD01004955.1.p1  ORF type:complete len:229 (-),score=43.82 GFUD01004955.1:44-730(-)